MNSEIEKSMNKDDRSDSSYKANPQQNKNFEQSQSGNKSDVTKQGSEVNSPKYDKQHHSDDRHVEDIDSERHPEEQVPDVREFTKRDNKNYNDKSERA